MFQEKIVGWAPHETFGEDQTVIGGALGSGTPIPVKAMKGWLFLQSWLSNRPGEQRHPLRWTSISKGQVWCAPPKRDIEHAEQEKCRRISKR